MVEQRQAEEEGGIEALMFEGDETPVLLRRPVIAALVVGFAMLVGLYFGVSSYFGLSTEIDAEPFQEFVERQGALGPVVFILIMALSVLIAPIPNAPIFFAAGLAWGPFLGTVYSLAGLLLGSAAAFWLSRRLGRKWLPRLVGRRIAARTDGLAETMGGKVVFFARMLPVINFDWLSFIAGVTAIKFRTFFIASALGMVIPTGAAVVAGDGLGRDFRITAAAIGAWLGGVLLSALYYGWRGARYRSRRRNERARAASQATTGEQAVR